jgi:dTDP-4-amino-4,6-dideoxygalactose transaminase
VLERWARETRTRLAPAFYFGRRVHENDWQLGGLPRGYDHKYTYSHLGYNLKMTDMQSAIGVSEIHKLADLIAKRRANFRLLRERALHGDHLSSDAHSKLDKVAVVNVA